MQELASHTIERSVVDAKTRTSVDFLDAVLEQLGDRPDLLPTVFRRELQVAAGSSEGPLVTATANAMSSFIDRDRESKGSRDDDE